jgi:hypothetical protein
LEGLIDELEMSVSGLEQHTENQACLLKRAEEEILEWESWNRGISAKHKKAKGWWHRLNSVRLLNIRLKNRSYCPTDAAMQPEILYLPIRQQ